MNIRAHKRSRCWQMYAERIAYWTFKRTTVGFGPVDGSPQFRDN